MRAVAGVFVTCARLSAFLHHHSVRLDLVVSLFTSLFSTSRSKIVSQDGWWRLEYEEVMAPAPAEESGAGLARGEESGTFF